MDNLNNSGKLIGALLVGTAIGGALGILFAPDKGSETRKKIIGKSDDLTDAIKEKFNEFLDNFKEEVGVVKDKANELMENGKAKAEKLTHNN
jgi:gas vesicle protein